MKECVMKMVIESWLVFCFSAFSLTINFLLFSNPTFSVSHQIFSSHNLFAIRALMNCILQSSYATRQTATASGEEKQTQTNQPRTTAHFMADIRHDIGLTKLTNLLKWSLPVNSSILNDDWLSGYNLGTCLKNWCSLVRISLGLVVCKSLGLSLAVRHVRSLWQDRVSCLSWLVNRRWRIGLLRWLHSVIGWRWGGCFLGVTHDK